MRYIMAGALVGIVVLILSAAVAELVDAVNEALDKWR